MSRKAKESDSVIWEVIRYPEAMSKDSVGKQIYIEAADIISAIEKMEKAGISFTKNTFINQICTDNSVKLFDYTDGKPRIIKRVRVTGPKDNDIHIIIPLNKNTKLIDCLKCIKEEGNTILSIEDFCTQAIIIK